MANRPLRYQIEVHLSETRRWCEIDTGFDATTPTDTIKSADATGANATEPVLRYCTVYASVDLRVCGRQHHSRLLEGFRTLRGGQSVRLNRYSASTTMPEHRCAGPTAASVFATQAAGQFEQGAAVTNGVRHADGQECEGGFGEVMSIERAEKLKRELTDKWVVVTENTPELRRFTSLTGKVKTVNMNCRALVQFDNPVDISWYDIDPQYLTVVDAPAPKPEKSHAKEAPVKAAAPAASKPAASGGGSPLDKIRAAAGGAKPAPADGSPLDAIRAQAGGGAKPAAATPASGSPLDKIRAQAAGGSAPAAPAPEKKGEEKAEEAPAAKPAAAPKPSSNLSPLDQIRAQGGFKG